jgi:hypothetical protein
MALMKKGRMTVKTTTKPTSSKTSSDRFTTGKSGVKNTPEVTVTGKRPTVSGPTTAEEEYKQHYKYGGYNEYVGGIGKKTKHSKLSPEELEKYNQDSYKNRSSKLIAKEVRVQSNLSAEDRKNSTSFGGYQVDYFDPVKDKSVYEAADSKRKAVSKLSSLTSPKSATPAKPATTPYKKPADVYQEYLKPGPPRPVEMVNKAIEGPSGKGRKIKNTPRVGGSIQKNKITKTNMNIKGQIEGAKFRREEKLAGAYTRTKEAIQKKGDDASWNMGLHPKNKAKQTMLKDFKGELKTAKKSATDKVAKKAAGSAIKDVRKSQRFEKREVAGRNKYFTKEKMAEQVEKKPGMKGRMQAGKMRYK